MRTTRPATARRKPCERTVDPFQRGLTLRIYKKVDQIGGTGARVVTSSLDRVVVRVVQPTDELHAIAVVVFAVVVRRIGGRGQSEDLDQAIVETYVRGADLVLEVGERCFVSAQTNQGHIGPFEDSASILKGLYRGVADDSIVRLSRAVAALKEVQQLTRLDDAEWHHVGDQDQRVKTASGSVDTLLCLFHRGRQDSHFIHSLSVYVGNFVTIALLRRRR